MAGRSALIFANSRSGAPSKSSARSLRSTLSMPRATTSGESMPTPSSAFMSRTRSVASAVRVARGATSSIGTLMTYALWLELDAVERYRELADAMEMHNNREVAKLFRTMAQYESKHAQQILEEMGWKEAEAPAADPAASAA